MTRWKTPLGEAEVTPEEMYLRRRDFLKLGAAGAIGAAGALSLALPGEVRGRRAGRRGAAGGQAGGAGRRRCPHAVGRRHHLQQLLRAGDRQGGSGPARRRAAAAPLDGDRRRRGEEAAHPRRRRALEALPARGAGLPDALRRGLVDGDPLGRLPARRPAPPGRADLEGPVRGLPDAARPGPAARPAPRRARLALRGGAAHRRGHPPAHAAGGRALRPRPPWAERGAAPAGGAVEVRLQGGRSRSSASP